MSVIVKTSEGVIKVLTKGSDSVLNKLLLKVNEISDEGIEQKLIRQ